MRKKRSDELREAIEEKIAIGVYPPRMRLDETVLLAEFGVSRTPLREALIHLKHQGLIELRPRRGAVVTEVSPQRLVEMFEVMAELEAMCGRLAARRMNAEDKVQLLAAHNACKLAAKSQNPDDYYYPNEKFHFAIYSASHNGYLEEQARQLHRKMSVYRRLQLRVRDRIGNSFTEHDDVVNAMLAGDSELTAQLLRKHVAIQGERFGDLISSLSALAA